jgi:hypothetical protein
MSRWTPEEDVILRDNVESGLSAAELALLLPDRTADAVWGRCRKIGLKLRAAEHTPLREYLAEGGCVVRENVGGAIGIHWAKATRSGSAFATSICERFVALGFLKPIPERENVFRWARP